LGVTEDKEEEESKVFGGLEGTSLYGKFSLEIPLVNGMKKKYFSKIDLGTTSKRIQIRFKKGEEEKSNFSMLFAALILMFS